jgi:hypothetical protein
VYTYLKEVTVLQSRSKVLLSAVLVAFIISATNTSILGTNEFAVLPANCVEIPENPAKGDKKRHRSNRNTATTGRYYYRRRAYHRRII